MKLVARTRAEVLSTLDALPPEIREQMSPKWLAMLAASAPQDPWVHGFNIVNADGAPVGLASFKGPPIDGQVEIAYAVEPQQQGKGFASGAARLLVEFALASGKVTAVCAHTLPDGIASQRVLAKAGFEKAGEVIDPEDGLVWRYQWRRAAG
jgi:ribosomal-protein-alanine N-acetyltransferase